MTKRQRKKLNKAHMKELVAMCMPYGLTKSGMIGVGHSHRGTINGAAYTVGCPKPAPLIDYTPLCTWISSKHANDYIFN
jgi:hypothetical protein